MIPGDVTSSDDKVARTIAALTLLYAPIATTARPRRTRKLRPPVLEALAVDEPAAPATARLG